MRPESARADTPETPVACRNCNAPTTGEYCATCGQETRIPLPTARVFLREATGRYVALDGRLWRTLAALMFHPGYLTREYLLGRRRRYIRPARLFLVLSLALFAAIRLFANAPVILSDDSTVNGSAKAGAKPVVKFDKDEEGGDIGLPGVVIHVDRDLNLSVEGADSALTRELKRRFEHFNGLNNQEKSEQVFGGAVRYGPYAMFVLMPAFALLQMIVYAGRGRRYPDRPRRYAEHLVFAAHTHAFLFLIGVLALAIPVTPLRAALCIWCLVYGSWATKMVYRGRWIGLVGRAAVVGFSYLILFGFVVAGLLLTAILLH